MAIVDAWLNVIEAGVPPEFFSGPVEAIAGQFHRQLAELQQGEPRASLVERLDRSGVERGLISAFPVGELAEFEHELALLASICADYPGRFGAAPYLPLEMGMAAARAVTAAKAAGCCAVRVMPARVGLPPSDRLYYPAFTKCVEESLPVTINVGLPGPALPAETQRPLELDRICRDFPELVVVATHMGWPWQEELIGLMLRHSNLYAMTSAWAPRYYPAEMVAFIKGRGQGRVMFASDHPLVPVERCIEEVSQLGLGDEARERFMRETALGVFF